LTGHAEIAKRSAPLQRPVGGLQIAVAYILVRSDITVGRTVTVVGARQYRNCAMTRYSNSLPADIQAPCVTCQRQSRALVCKTVLVTLTLNCRIVFISPIPAANLQNRVSSSPSHKGCYFRGEDGIGTPRLITTTNRKVPADKQVEYGGGGIYFLVALGATQ